MRVGIGFVSSVLVLTANSGSVEAFTSTRLTSQTARRLKRSTNLKHHLSSESQNEKDGLTNGRRRLLASFAASSLAVGGFSIHPEVAQAYEKSFPDDLDFEDGDLSKDLVAAQQAKIAAKRAQRTEYMDYVTDSNPLFFRNPKDLLTCLAWGGALWLLSGSRSNPLVTPLANLLYDEDEEWLKDRNDGLFASLPLSLFVILGIVFFALGIVTDRLVLFVAEGSASVSLQLAGVTLIGAAAIELGRVATGEKGQTRDDYDRDLMLEREFEEFAENRLQKGGNCHRSEVVKAFRRYNAKYRQADSTQYPLGDLEIEQLLRSWSQATGAAEMSSAGFYNGISINQQADVFVER